MNILITGSSSGLGYALVNEFLKDPKNVVYGLSRSSSKIDNPNYHEILSSSGSNYDFTKMTSDDYEDLGRSLLLIDYDIIINNAGMTNRSSLSDHSIDDIQDLINVNLTAPMIITKLTEDYDHPQLFINILSGAAVSNFRYLPVYSAAKGGLYRFSHQRIKDYNNMNIKDHKILNIIPGPFNSKLCPDHYKNSGSVLELDELVKFIMNSIDEINSSDQLILDKKINTL